MADERKDSIWRRFFRRITEPQAATAPVPEESAPPPSNTVELPTEPFVFECQSCGKVFEARRKRTSCPECDSTDVTIVSD